MGVVAVVPARAGSKSIKDKNIIPIAGHPLLSYSVRAAKLCGNIDRVFLSTDSPDYAQIGKKYGAETPFLRSPEISEDESIDLEWVQHFLSWWKANESEIPDLLVHLRPTTPLRDPEVITEAIEIFKELEQATALRSVHQMSQTAYKCFEKKEEYLVTSFHRQRALDFSNQPRDAYPKTFDPNGYVDILRPFYVEKACQLHGDHVIGFETKRVADIDTEEDIEYLEFGVAKNKSLIQLLFEGYD